jgi:hypothetical protein
MRLRSNRGCRHQIVQRFHRIYRVIVRHHGIRKQRFFGQLNGEFSQPFAGHGYRPFRVVVGDNLRMAQVMQARVLGVFLFLDTEHDAPRVEERHLLQRFGQPVPSAPRRNQHAERNVRMTVAGRDHFASFTFLVITTTRLVSAFTKSRMASSVSPFT